MMKKLLANKLLTIILALTPISVLAHSGHLANESIHGLLHGEHIISLAILGVIAFSIYVLRRK